MFFMKFLGIEVVVVDSMSKICFIVEVYDGIDFEMIVFKEVMESFWLVRK